MPAQNTTRMQPGTNYQAKPARRTHRRLLTPPLAQKNGIDPIQLILPHLEKLPAELFPNSTAPATVSYTHLTLPTNREV